MKKRRSVKLSAKIAITNPVAKYAPQFNKAKVFEDKSKYRRGAKHKGREPFIMSWSQGITKGDLLMAFLNVTPSLH